MSNFQSKYKILEQIGEGSFSEVLKCQNRETGEYYAAKRLKKSYKSNEGVLNCAEIIAAQKIPCHQNVLNLLEFHYENISGKAIFIFELMDMSMYDLLRNRTSLCRRIPEIRVKIFLYQILKGLTHLHNHGLFHRDVKPENILIKMTSEGEQIKLADLGSVRGIYSEPPYTEYISTRWYRSPECLLTIGNYGPKMDIWATGCVFYEMLTLKPLFPGSNELDQLHKIHSVLGTPNGKLLEKLKHKSRNCTCFPETPGAGLSSILTNFSEHAKRLLKLMLEYDPDKRINARRLLQSVYFDAIRFGEDRVERLLNSAKMRMEQRSRNAGDSMNTTRTNSSLKNRNGSKSRTVIKDSKKRDSIKTREISSSRKSALNVSGTLLDITGPHVLKSVGNLKSKITHKESKLSTKTPKILLSTQVPEKPKHIKKSLQEKYRKTTSNLVQNTKPLITQQEISESKKFQSKSFVQPQRRYKKLTQTDEASKLIEKMKRKS